ncbi:Ig lambda chain V-IV region Bau [Sciurus carolinensis]|uniref:Ig lambda chain V-IV region Bau n=1 Tax=Sciurus carolinensis TaxID=30640 RepID=A0AA41MFP7_SCICA|nr:Ig lambda chain V-IV region Bau [Sciurus carolinensis]
MVSLRSGVPGSYCGHHRPHHHWPISLRHVAWLPADLASLATNAMAPRVCGLLRAESDMFSFTYFKPDSLDHYSAEKLGIKYVSWYQQKPSQAAMLVIYRDSNSPQESLTESLTPTQEISILTISGLQALDEAEY